MTSSTLYREGDDLDTLLAELSAEYDGRVRIVTVDEGRIGGVGGFFARRRVGVHFTVDEAQPASAMLSADPLAELIDRAQRQRDGLERERLIEAAAVLPVS
jgi:hypothetical protein